MVGNTFVGGLYGLCNNRTKASQARARPSRRLDYMQWFAESQDPAQKIRLRGLPPHEALGMNYVVPIIRKWKIRVRLRDIDPSVYFRTYKNTETLRDAYHLLQQTPGLVGVSSSMRDLLLRHLRLRLEKGIRKPGGSIAKKKNPVLLQLPWHPVLDTWDRRTLSKRSPIVKELPPAMRKDFPPMVMNNYDTPLYPRFTNNSFGSEWSVQKIHEFLTTDCACSQPRFSSFLHPATKSPEGELHVLTNDCALVALYNQNLSTLMNKGAQYRCTMPEPLHDIDFESCVDSMLQQLVARHGDELFHGDHQRDFRADVLRSLREHVDRGGDLGRYISDIRIPRQKNSSRQCGRTPAVPAIVCGSRRH